MFDKVMYLFAHMGAMLRTLFFLVSLLIMIVYISYPAMLPSSENKKGQSEVILTDHANADSSNTPLTMTEQNQLSWSAAKGIGK